MDLGAVRAVIFERREVQVRIDRGDPRNTVSAGFKSEHIEMRSALMGALAVGLYIFSGILSVAVAAPLQIVSEPAPGDPGASSFVVHSARLGRDFLVSVHMRPLASLVLSGQKFPAIYALDGGYGLAGPDGVLMAITGVMEPSIVVSVGYLPNQKAFRSTDLLHNRTMIGGVQMGVAGLPLRHS